jgi:tricorn protease
VRIEFDDIQNRAKALTNTRDGVGSVTLSPDARTVIFAMSVGGQTDWWAGDINSGATTRVTNGVGAGSSVEFAEDASRFYYLTAGGTIMTIARQTGTPAPVAFNGSMEIDRRVEVAEAFNEAWRNLRTQFYDPKMHGTDWVALRAKYEPLLAETAAKEDFVWILQSMIGELNASHTGATAPAGTGPTVATGYLGLTFDQDYAGPGLKVASVLPKGPSDQLLHKIEPGEYILSIDGTDAALTEPLYQSLADRVGRTVELLVNNKPVKEGARNVKIRPIARTAIDDLDYENWVATRRKKVDLLSGGRLAYIHIKAMDQPSLQKFEREIFGDAQSKEGLVLDIRFNGGGRIHDDLLNILTRKPHVYETPRDGERATQPFQLWNRPTTLLINEYSASDSEIFPNGFREFGLGKIVGVPTYGGVIGTVDITLVDGTRFRIPRTGWSTLQGKNLENWGVPPDILVEQTPEDNASDSDKQLEAAVKSLLQQLPAR